MIFKGNIIVKGLTIGEISYDFAVEIRNQAWNLCVLSRCLTLIYVGKN